VNVAYGAWGQGGAWGTSFADRFRFPYSTTEEQQTIYVQGQQPSGQQPSGWQWAQNADPARSRERVSAGDIADITSGIGAMTTGIASLVHGGRPDVQVATPTQPQVPVAAPMNTGLVILGIGSVILVGLLGVAASMGGQRRRV
jgi:hypothetical protein